MRDVLANSALDLGEILEERLQLPIGMDKTVVTASDPALARRLAANLQSLGGQGGGRPTEAWVAVRSGGRRQQ